MLNLFMLIVVCMVIFMISMALMYFGFIKYFMSEKFMDKVMRTSMKIMKNIEIDMFNEELEEKEEA